MTMRLCPHHLSLFAAAMVAMTDGQAAATQRGAGEAQPVEAANAPTAPEPPNMRDGVLSSARGARGDSVVRSPAEQAERAARTTAFVALPSAGCAGPCLTPSMAIEQAAGAAPEPAAADEYAFHVRAVGSDDGRMFINSEPDYRDQRNLTLALSPRAVSELQRLFGAVSIEHALVGYPIVVRGRPRRVRIDFTDGAGRPTGLYYYQTHIAITRASQISRPPAPRQQRR